MIDFSTLQGVAIPEGVVTQIESGGVVLWRVAEASGPIVLEVEKYTSDTYAGETTYTGESFILLNIYPKMNGTVSVTYGGLTKTITDTSGAESPNAQQVFFGTFNGVSDSVETPASGTLTIDGDYAAFGCGGFVPDSKAIVKSTCACVISVLDFGGVKLIPTYAFGSNATQDDNIKLKEITTAPYIEQISDFSFVGCKGLVSVTLKNGIKSIGLGAFNSCTLLNTVIIPKSLTTIVSPIFNSCTALTNIVIDEDNECFSSEGGALFDKKKTTLMQYSGASGHYNIPDTVTAIGENAFYKCTDLTSVVIPSGVTEIGSVAFSDCTGLENMTILATTPPTIKSASSVGGADLTFPIAVPVGCGEAYKAAEFWSECADRIVEVS